MNLTAKVETITPEQAAKYLSNNPMNRQLQHHLIRRYAKQMRDGLWQLIPAPICFAKSGKLMQGQHRLSAQVESKTDQDYLVCRDLDEDLFALLDTGRSRNANDMLHIDGGFNYPELTGSLVLQYLKYEAGNFWGKGNAAETPMPSDILAYALENKEDLCMTINHVKSVSKRSTYFSERVFAASYHIISHHTSKEAVDIQKFFSDLIGGEEKDLHPSIEWLRSEMLVNKNSNRKLRWQNIYATIFYAWNGYINKSKFIPVNPESCRDVDPN